MRDDIEAIIQEHCRDTRRISRLVRARRYLWWASWAIIVIAAAGMAAVGIHTFFFDYE